MRIRTLPKGRQRFRSLSVGQMASQPTCRVCDAEQTAGYCQRSNATPYVGTSANFARAYANPPSLATKTACLPVAKCRHGLRAEAGGRRCFEEIDEFARGRASLRPWRPQRRPGRVVPISFGYSFAGFLLPQPVDRGRQREQLDIRKAERPAATRTNVSSAAALVQPKGTKRRFPSSPGRPTLVSPQH